MKLFKGRKLNTKSLVKVYRNLHTRGYSVMQNNLVVAHANSVKLKSVSFKVSRAGRFRANRERTRNVHAFAIGYLCQAKKLDKLERVSYNPFQDSSFNVNHKPVYSAEFVLLNSTGCFICKNMSKTTTKTTIKATKSSKSSVVKSARRATVDKTFFCFGKTVKIQKGVPLPSARSGGSTGGTTIDLLKAMKVGDSAVLPKTAGSRGIHTYVENGKAQNLIPAGAKFATRTLPDGLGVWRTE